MNFIPELSIILLSPQAETFWRLKFKSDKLNKFFQGTYVKTFVTIYSSPKIQTFIFRK